MTASEPENMQTNSVHQVDSITEEVLRNKFESIADEMQSTLIRSAYSAVIKESEDATSGLFNAEGRTIAQATANPGHHGMLIPAIKAILNEYPVEEMAPEDVYLFNDPFHGDDDAGGTHLPDITIIKPIFHDGEVIAIGATMGHHQDIGGMAPSSMPPNATEIYQEGLRLQPLKLHDEGEPNETVLEIIRKNVRIPEIVQGDLNAQISALNIADRRLQEVVEEYGSATILQAFDQLIAHAEQRTRDQLEEFPDGEYSFVDFLDDDGITHHDPIRLEITVEIDGSDVHVDCTGTDDQVEGPFNAVPSAAMSNVYYMMGALTAPKLRPNAGTFEPVSAHFPEGSILNPRPPAAVNARSTTLKRLTDVLLGAFAQAVPERIPAAGCRPFATLSFGGTRDDHSSWIFSEFPVGGNGGQPMQDGTDFVHKDTTNPTSMEAEPTEMVFPVRVRGFSLWEDSAGAGRYRGGFGCRKRFEMLADDISLSHRRDRHDTQPWGLNGGRSAPTCKTIIERSSGEIEEIPSKVQGRLDAGDVLDLYCSGGGGYGDPRARPIEEVQTDLDAGVISPQHAEEAYGVVVDDDDGQIDREATDDQRPDVEYDPHIEPGEITIDRGILPESIDPRGEHRTSVYF
jgi:N-methylhydantoinase B